MISHPAADRTFPIGALLAGVGGVAAVVGSFMTWWEQAGGLFSSGAKVTGWDLDGGKIAAVLGVVAVVLVLIWVLRLEHPMPPFRASGLAMGSSEALIALIGVCVLVIALVNYGDASKATIGLGYWLTLFAGAAVTAGGILGLVAGQHRA